MEGEVAIQYRWDSAEERNYQALKIVRYWGDTLWNFPGNQRNTVAPSPSPPDHYYRCSR